MSAPNDPPSSPSASDDAPSRDPRSHGRIRVLTPPPPDVDAALEGADAVQLASEADPELAALLSRASWGAGSAARDERVLGALRAAIERRDRELDQTLLSQTSPSLAQAPFPERDPARDERVLAAIARQRAERARGASERRRKSSRSQRRHATGGAASGRSAAGCRATPSRGRSRRRKDGPLGALIFAGAVAAVALFAILINRAVRSERAAPPTDASVTSSQPRSPGTGRASSVGSSAGISSSVAVASSQRSSVKSSSAASRPARPTLTQRIAAAGESVEALAGLLDELERKDERQRVATRILQLDAAHARAHRILGYVWRDGRWMSREQYDQWLATRPAADTPELSALAKLEGKLAAAGDDPDALWRVKRWAESNDLPGEVRRIARRVVQLAPQHAGAHLALGHVRYGDRWVTPDELEQLLAQDSGNTSSLPGDARPRAFASLGDGFFASAAKARGDRFDLWLQQPKGRHSASQVQRALSRLTVQITRTTEAFFRRNDFQLTKGGETQPGRLQIAVFTDTEAYASYCENRSVVEAAHEAGFVVEDEAIALVRPMETMLGGGYVQGGYISGEADALPLYDQFLLAAYEEGPRREHRVLRVAGLEAQRRLAAPVRLTRTDQFLVASPIGKGGHKESCAHNLDKLEAVMAEDGLLPRPAREGQRGVAMLVCGSRDIYTATVNRAHFRQPQIPGWRGTYEPSRKRRGKGGGQRTVAHWISEKSDLYALLHGGATTLLYQRAARLPMDTDVVWLHDGVAHYAVGRAMGREDAVQPGWTKSLKSIYKRGSTISIRKMVRTSRGRQPAAWKRQTGLVQAQSWALVHFLMHADQGAHRKRLRQLLATREPLTHDRVRAILGARLFDDLEKRVIAHVEGLPE